MDIPFPDAPATVRSGLARPSVKFRLQAWAAISGLVLFLGLYFGLTAWFAWIAWGAFRMLGSSRGVFATLIVALPALFLFLVMAKGLFYVRRGAAEGLVEVKQQDEPVLLAFVRRVAQEVGAPRPHRVFLSSRVNAAVFYDTALWNLVVPSKKNLEIGLGLVNALSLDEFKAVVAHEFGHFAQRSMAVGRWVYLTQQFVGDLIVRRDVFDRFLDGVSRTDVRIAWIGWSLRLIVWSIRALLDTAFRGVIALERALGRQMEFQADRVAVVATGSDSLIHALSRIMAADDAWDRAVGFAVGESRGGRPVADLFAVQSRMMERLRQVLDDPGHGLSPVVPAVDRHRFRVFQSGIAESPRMWSTHPPNHEREENAKDEYVPSTLDERPAWVLFANPERLRSEMTRRLLTELGIEESQTPVPVADSLRLVDTQFGRPSLDARYQGIYLGRELSRHARAVAELYSPMEPTDREAVFARLDGLYPSTVRDDVNRWRDLVQEKKALEGLREGWLTAVGGVIRFRGRQVRRKELPRLIDHVDDDIDDLEQRLRAHDREVRTTHVQAARLVGGSREARLVGLLTLAHYAEHTQAALRDAAGYLGHVFSLAAADRKITKREMERLHSAAARVFDVLERIHEQRKSVRWTERTPAGEQECDLGHWLPDTFDLPAPTVEDIARGWLAVLDGHVQGYEGALSALRSRSLDLLIAAEAETAEALRNGVAAGEVGGTGVPASYRRLLPGGEKPRGERLGWWERFQIADGLLPGAARFAAAACILAPALVYSWSAGRTTVAAHNGLGTPVTLEVAGHRQTVDPGASIRFSVSPGLVEVRAVARDGTEIESFEAEVCKSCTIVYNVAHASALVEWTAAYGNATPQPSRFIGAPRWLESDADHVLEDPPETMRLKGGGAILRVVHALDRESPAFQFASVPSEEEQSALVLAHARWDPLDHPDLSLWMSALADHPDFGALWRSRLNDTTPNVGLQRIRMDHATEDERAALCTTFTARAESVPDDPDAIYLSTRCLPDGPEQNDRFVHAAERFPHHMWLSWASYVARLERDELALALTVLERLAERADAHRTVLGPRVDQDFVRLRRWSAAEPSEADFGSVERRYPTIREALAVETWVKPPPTSSPHARATFHLLRGELDESLTVVELAQEERRSIVLRVALSEGATPEQVDAGFAVLPPGRSESTLLWPALALAVREGRDPSVLLQTMADRPEFTRARIPDGLVERGRRLPVTAFEEAVVGLPPDLRGAARVAGIVLYGEAAPMEWRREAKALLFPAERPFLR